MPHVRSIRLERHDDSSNRHPVPAYCWIVIFFRKPVLTPDQVRGRLFRDHAREPSSRDTRRCNALCSCVPPASTRSHAFLRKLLGRVLVLGEMRQSHATQHVRRLGELNIVIADDLDAVAPWIPESRKSRKRPGNGLIPAAASALRTASLSSTTRPKWRPSSAGCLRPFCSARNWSPRSMKAAVLLLPRSSKSSNRP